MKKQAGSTLCAHAGAHRVTLAELRTLPDPEKLGRIHTPVRHDVFVDGLLSAILTRGLEVTKQEFAVMRGGAKLFGVIDFASKDSEMGHCLGFRHGNDRSMRVRIVAGQRVFVCDNMALSGDEVVMNRLHTNTFDILNESIASIDKYLEARDRITHEVIEMKQAKLSDADAKMLIYNAVVQNDVLPLRMLPSIDRWYFKGETEDVRPRTAWGLHNAFTRTIQELPSLNQKMDASSAITKYLTSVV